MTVEVASDVQILTRGQWQASIGSVIFDDYYRLATEQAPPLPMVLDFRETPEQALIDIGFTSADRLVKRASGGTAEQALAPHIEELITYTDIESLARPREHLGHAIYKHMADGLRFAHCTTMGLALEVMRAAGLSYPDYDEVYKGAVHVLENPNMVRTIRSLSLTGFAVYKSTAAPDPAALEDVDMRRMMINLGLPEVLNPVMVSAHADSVEDLSTIDIEVKPAVVAALRKALAKGNHRLLQGKPAGSPSFLYHHAGKPGFSSGCPVAHNTTTFPAMLRYLADTVRLTRQAEAAQQGDASL